MSFLFLLTNAHIVNRFGLKRLLNALNVYVYETDMAGVSRVGGTSYLAVPRCFGNLFEESTEQVAFLLGTQ